MGVILGCLDARVRLGKLRSRMIMRVRMVAPRHTLSGKAETSRLILTLVHICSPMAVLE